MMRTPAFGTAAVAITLMVATSACSSGGSEDVQPTSASTPAPATAAPQTTDVSTPSPSERVTSQAPETNVPTPAELDANPEISIASWNSLSGTFIVGGYVTGIVEIGGSCTFVVTNHDSGTDVVVHTEGVDNSDSTSCGSVDIPGAQIPDGAYSVVLTYTNSKGSVSSDVIDVAVQR